MNVQKVLELVEIMDCKDNYIIEIPHKKFTE